MAAGSRKRRRPDGRSGSPPLCPSSLLTRNLSLLPVGLTQLPNDEAFVAQLRKDIDDLLSAFAEALLLKIVKDGASSSHDEEAGSSHIGITPRTGSEPSAHNIVSPFSIFAQIWRQKGWHYVQFAFADHTDSKRDISRAICRVLLEHLRAYVAQRNDTSKEQDSRIFVFADLKQLYKVMAVPFALYLLWSTQIYPTSGIGVKHCRPAMERIIIEQDYYDLLLDLPESISQQLQSEDRTKASTDASMADLTEVVCRLVGRSSDEQPPQPSLSTTQVNASKSRPRQVWHHGVDSRQHTSWAGHDPVFDIIPASSFATRLPRNWPSVRVMSSLEANKEFGRVGTVVRVSRAADSADETREAVAGLSRGDVVRLKARQRLAVASTNVSKLLQHSGRSGTASVPAGPSESLPYMSDPILRDATQTARYDIEVPSWVRSAKYTASMQPWLEETSNPVRETLQRVSRSKKRYHESRDKIMRSHAASASTDDDRGMLVATDYGEWVLRNFREQRRALQSNEASVREVGTSDNDTAMDRGLAEVNEAGTISIDALYSLAAKRTKAAAVERGEMLKSAKVSGSQPT